MYRECSLENNLFIYCDGYANGSVFDQVMDVVYLPGQYDRFDTYGIFNGAGL